MGGGRGAQLLTRGKAPTVVKLPSLGAEATPFHTIPAVDRLVDKIKLGYHNAASVATGGDAGLLAHVLASTPLPVGKDKFSSVHVVAPPVSVKCAVAEGIVASLQGAAGSVQKEVRVHRLPESCTKVDPMAEYTAVFETTSQLLLAKADRASLIIYVGWEDVRYDFYASIIGMLPFRGVTTAIITQRAEYGDLLTPASPSGVFAITGANAARMGMFPLKAAFGPLASTAFTKTIADWTPVDLAPVHENEDPRHASVHLPFKIGALTVPMLTHNGAYKDAVDGLGQLLEEHYGEDYLPIVSCGETNDALGYGQDILDNLRARAAAKGRALDGYYFHHPSGESHKSWEYYGTPELFAQISAAKARGVPAVVIAVGGGVNGNCIGLIAACTDSHLVEVPTTPMHYNDATTSAKKAFSLVRGGKILSKNIMGAFYIPRLVYCISETFLTLSSASAHSAVGEACKTMNMLGMTNTEQGAKDYYNIEGGAEFQSDYTKICKEVVGFDALVRFIDNEETQRMKGDIIAVGKQIRKVPSDDLRAKRGVLLDAFRARYYGLGEEKVQAVKSFISVLNREIVMAKAMFLAYEDPFEKYRALLFEYAHTLGHGVEAFLNLAYTMAKERGVEIPAEAERLHGQCVGMAVLWAGQMSQDLGVLKGDAFKLHQGFVYLFNRHGGFDFGPVRALLDSLKVSEQQFVDGVIDVVRRDNKRGYCEGSGVSKSVDQLVAGRPGKMLKSPMANAEIRYLVEVEEEWQAAVLRRAFAGEFDQDADIDSSRSSLLFRPRTAAAGPAHTSAEVATFIHDAVKKIYWNSR